MASKTIIEEEDPTVPLLGHQHGAEASPPKEPPQGLRELLATPPIPFLLALILIFEFAIILGMVPVTAIIETAICQRHADSLGPEGCKSIVVQKELALVKGWLVTAETIPSIVAAVPYGRLADSIGRVPVIRWSIIGMLINCMLTTAICYWSHIFPTRLVWAAAFTLLIGGGSGVFNAMIFTMTADVSSEKTRTVAFSYLTASVQLSGIAAMPICSLLMDFSNYVAIAVGAALCLLALLLTYFIPETLQEPAIPAGVEPVAVERLPLGKKIRLGLRSIFSGDFSFLWSSWSMIILLLSSFLITVGRYTIDLVMQYATKRFGWSWSQANYIVMMLMVCTAIELLVLLPWINIALDKTFKWTPSQRDLWLSRLFVVLFLIGTLIVGFAWTPVLLFVGMPLFALGTPFQMLVRSMMTSMVDKHHIGALYNIISVIQFLSLTISGPLLAQAFRFGLDKGGIWLGLPYLCTAVSLMVITAGMCLVRVPKNKRMEEQSDEDGEAQATTSTE